jgi:hypothetical protein
MTSILTSFFRLSAIMSQYIYVQKACTEEVKSGGNICDSYLGDAWFKFQPGSKLEIFMFSIMARQMMGMYLKSGHYCFHHVPSNSLFSDDPTIRWSVV